MKIFRIPLVITLWVLAGWAFDAGAQIVTYLYSFGNPPDGHYPEAGLVQGSDGYFYGTTVVGGTSNSGTVFRISASGGYSNLYSFGTVPNDGGHPYAGLVQGSDGYFYGTTYGGGAIGFGTVFRISPGGSYSNLYSFASVPNDGTYPYAGLVQGSDGYFYGTTFSGGANNEGTVFRISASGSYSKLYSFASVPHDGTYPYAAPVQGRDGYFYGTTTGGGANNRGTVFRISASGSYSNLYSFGNPPDGQSPYQLVQGSDGYFYGTAGEGGNGVGTVFRISASGSYSNLHSFASVEPPNDGWYPTAALVQGSDGYFYGTTSSGGTSYYGTVFRISASGSFSNLYSFGGDPNDGADPALVQGSDGYFYGTTFDGGGANTNGTVFRLTVPLSPPPNQISVIELAGSDVVLDIPSVAGETYQLQSRLLLTESNWSNVPDAAITNSIGGLLTVTNFGGAFGPQGFYRFDITP